MNINEMAPVWSLQSDTRDMQSILILGLGPEIDL